METSYVHNNIYLTHLFIWYSTIHFNNQKHLPTYSNTLQINYKTTNHYQHTIRILSLHHFYQVFSTNQLQTSTIIIIININQINLLPRILSNFNTLSLFNIHHHPSLFSWNLYITNQSLNSTNLQTNTFTIFKTNQNSTKSLLSTSSNTNVNSNYSIIPFLSSFISKSFIGHLSFLHPSIIDLVIDFHLCVVSI